MNPPLGHSDGRLHAMPAPVPAQAPGYGTDYRAPGWLPGAHPQTIWPVVVGRGRPVNLERVRWPTPDHDFVDVDLARPSGTPKALLILFHGLEGSSRSQYAQSIMRAAQGRGWLAAVAHFRGCGGQINLAPRAYHSGDSAEIQWMLGRFAQQWPDLDRYAVGVSLGGNALMKWAGESGHDAARVISGCAAVSAPQDLHASAIALSRGLSRVYTRHFLHSLKDKSLRKLAQYPGLFDRQRMLRADDFFAFDDAVTAPMHGFASCLDYWARSSCRQFLADVRVPSLMLNARNDPFLPPMHLARPDQVSSSVMLDYPAAGGHAGFLSGHPPGRNDWLGERMVRWFEQIGPDGALTNDHHG